MSAMREQGQPDIVCLGEPLVEFSQLPGEDVFRLGFGGDTSNAAIAAARQGARAAYVTAVGADAFGDALMELWQREGVDASRVRRDPAASTGIYFITHGPEGHRFTYYRKGSAASRLAPADLPLDTIAAARVLHVSGISQAISDTACAAVEAAIAAAKAAAALVSYDTNLRLALWPIERARPVIEATAAVADIVRPALDDARLLTGHSDPDDIVDHYLAGGAKFVALTMGRDGVLLASVEERRRLPGLPVASVDATGAGDVFDGALLARIVAGDDFFTAGAYANAAAALSTTGFGAVAPIPGTQAVRALLARQCAAG